MDCISGTTVVLSIKYLRRKNFNTLTQPIKKHKRSTKQKQSLMNYNCEYEFKFFLWSFVQKHVCKF